MSRPNANIIHAWADGSDVQYQQGEKWIDFDPTQLPWSLDRVYRIKPPQPWYRVAKLQFNGDADFTVAKSMEDEFHIEAMPSFVDWVTDRVYLDENE